MEELPIPIPSEEVEKFYCDLYSVSEKLTQAKNRYKALYEITQEFESPSLKERITRAASLRTFFINIETEILRLTEMLKPRPPKRNIFTGELEQEEAALGNEGNPAMTYSITRNDLLDETKYYIRLLDEKIEADLDPSRESSFKNDSPPSLFSDTPTSEFNTPSLSNGDLTNIAISINWKVSLEEFTNQINKLKEAQYLDLKEGFITFIHSDAYEDIISLFYYWYEKGNLIPRRRKNKDSDKKEITIPQKLIAQTFRRLDENNLVSHFDETQIGVIKLRSISEEIEVRIENFRKILN